MAIVGPNAPGIVNYFDRVAVTLEENNLVSPKRGVAIIAQSGSFGNNVSRNDRSLPIGYLLSTGNQSILESADYMEVLLDDCRVSAIGLHMEGLRDVAKFHHTAWRALKKGIPLVALKTGVSDRGVEAAMSHTASLATGDELFYVFIRRLGEVRARMLPEFIETLKLLATSALFRANGQRC